MEKTNSVSLDGLVSVCRSFLRHDDGSVEADFIMFIAIPNPDATADMPFKDRLKEFMHHRIKVVASAGAEAERITDLAESCRRNGTELRIYKAKGILIELSGESVVQCDSKDLVKSTILSFKDNNEAVIAGTIVSMTHSDAYANIVLDTGVSYVRTRFSKSNFGVAWDSVDSGKLRKGDMIWMKGPLNCAEYGDKSQLRSVLIPNQMKENKLKQDVTTKKKKSRGVE